MDSKKTDKYITIGENIRFRRKAKNLSQEQFARALGISVAAISSYETGKTAPSLEVAIKMTELFGVSLSTLLFKSDESDILY